MANQPNRAGHEAGNRRGSGDDRVVEHATGRRREQALALLLSATGTDGAAAVRRFRAFADDQDLSLDQTWLALERQRPVASVLIVPSAGRTGMIFLSPLSGREQAETVAALVRAACGGQDAEKVRLIQALLDPSQRLEAQVLTEADFRDLATLIYMRRSAEAPWTPLDPGPTIEVQHWQERHRQRFADAIGASYEQTRDCPILVGLRSMADIIAGHQAAGEFDPDLWFVLSCGAEPVGVMLLNKMPPRRALELVYLGIAPKWRGRGLARTLLEHGLALAKRCRLPNMILAVDQDNAPALRMYRSMQFVEDGRKLAKLMVVAGARGQGLGARGRHCGPSAADS